MMRRVSRNRCLCVMVGVGILLAPAARALQALGSTIGASPCSDIPHSDHPKAMLSNGKMSAVIFLPDKDNGYYRSTRFDWSGVVGCVAVNGHKFFGEWFAKYDPSKNDSIVGPVEEFRTDDGTMGHYGAGSKLLTVRTEAIGYNDAKPGETFLKPGVGVLRRVDDKPYAFGTVYPIVDGGTWKSQVTKTSVKFRQVLNGPDGYAYEYEKTLSLDKDGTGITLQHSLKNTGRKTIDTKVYDHDFFMFDGRPTGPGMVVRFPFVPKSIDPLDPAVKIDGKEIVFLDAIGPRKTVSGYITGFSASTSDYDFIVEDTYRHIGVEQTSDTPLSRIYFWSNSSVICPEAYIHLGILSGKTGRWKIHYHFFVPAE
jgi:hypothetical protein